MDDDKPIYRTEALPRQYQALLDMSKLLATQQGLAALLRELAQQLRPIVEFDSSAILLYDSARNLMRVHLVETDVPIRVQFPNELPMDVAPGGWVWKTQQPLLISKLMAEETKFPQIMRMLHANGVRSYCALPLNSAGRHLGALAFTHLKEDAWREDDLELLQQVTNQVGIAVENALNFESAQTAQQQLARERDRSRLLLEVNNAVVSHLALSDLLKSISTCLRRILPHDFAGLALCEPNGRELRVHAMAFPGQRDFAETGDLFPMEGNPSGLAVMTRQSVVIRRLDLTEFRAEVMKGVAASGIKSGCCVPLISHERVLGTLDVGSMQESAFTEDDAELLTQVGGQIAIAVENALAFREIEVLKNQLHEEKLYLEDELRSQHNFEEIIGEGTTLKRILKQVETVAPTDSTVLIRGETGTGKELIARAIHNLSARRERTLVKLNCAAIPTGLLESELFGHEKGAFTGAIAQRIGRFELAHRGTIFLDEVGDIPLELQPKLLRVLQEQEFERLGSTRTQRVDVRVVAATNCDLEEMVADKHFRSDLFYRLNVFPVTLPPLRERSEDIPLLVRFFAQKFAQRMRKRIEAIPTEALSVLIHYHWPGNIRELENVIERAVILSRGPELEIPVNEMKAQVKSAASAASTASTASTASHNSGDLTLEAAEREHVLRVLRETDWVVSGPTGAAARLGLNRSTLQSRMRKLGITRPR